MLALQLIALGLAMACESPEVKKWEPLIADGVRVEEELESLRTEVRNFFGMEPIAVCEKPISIRSTVTRINGEVSGLLDLSQELHRWQEYADGLAALGAGPDLRIVSAGHLAGIEWKVSERRFAFERGLRTLEFLGCTPNPGG